MRALLKLAGGLALLIALAQAYVWYDVASKSAQLAQDLRPDVELGYGSTFAWLSGRIGMRDVRIGSPHLSGGEITADSIDVDLGGPLGLFRFHASGDDGPPDEIDFAVRKLRVGAELERQLRGNASRLGYLAPYEALGCNDRGLFGGTDYAELDWQQTHADVHVRARRDQEGSAQSWTVAYDMAPLGRIDMALDLQGEPGEGWIGPAIGSRLRVERVELRYQDRGMLARRNAYCAGLHGIDEPAFLDRHMAAVADEMEARGFFPDPSVMDLYRDFAQRGGTLSLTALPGATVSIADYRHYRAEDQLAMLNAGLRLDDGALVPVKARFYSDGVGAGSVRPGATDTVRVNTDAEGADLLLFDELPDLVGRRIGVTTQGGQDYVGTLLGVQGPLVRVEIVQRGGQAQRIALPQDTITAMRLLE